MTALILSLERFRRTAGLRRRISRSNYLSHAGAVSFGRAIEQNNSITRPPPFFPTFRHLSRLRTSSPLFPQQERPTIPRLLFFPLPTLHVPSPPAWRQPSSSRPTPSGQISSARPNRCRFFRVNRAGGRGRASYEKKLVEMRDCVSLIPPAFDRCRSLAAVGVANVCSGGVMPLDASLAVATLSMVWARFDRVQILNAFGAAWLHRASGPRPTLSYTSQSLVPSLCEWGCAMPLPSPCLRLP